MVWVFQLVYVCWLAFEVGFIWRYLIETKNVRSGRPGSFLLYADIMLHLQRTLEETAA